MSRQSGTSHEYRVIRTKPLTVKGLAAALGIMFGSSIVGAFWGHVLRIGALDGAAIGYLSSMTILFILAVIE